MHENYKQIIGNTPSTNNGRKAVFCQRASRMTSKTAWGALSQFPSAPSRFLAGSRLALPHKYAPVVQNYWRLGTLLFKSNLLSSILLSCKVETGIMPNYTWENHRVDVFGGMLDLARVSVSTKIRTISNIWKIDQNIGCTVLVPSTARSKVNTLLKKVRLI